jgi:NADPH:quinone reductase
LLKLKESFIQSRQESKILELFVCTYFKMTQKALVVPAVGSPLILTERPIPSPKEGQVLVKVSVAGLNPHDSKAQAYGLFIKDVLPATLATDVAGTVTAVGPGVTRFKVGDEIFTFSSPMNPDACGTQEYAIVTADHAAKIPKGINDDEAAVLALNPLTAFWGIFREQGLGVPPPAPFLGHDPNFSYGTQSIVAVGGGSAVGKYIIQWAKYAGFGTIITTASKSKSEKELLSLGATHVLDRHASDSELEAQVRRIVGNDLVYVYDAVNVGQGAEVGAKLLSSAKPGRLVVISGGDFDASRVKGKKGGFERKMVFSAPWMEPELAKSYWHHIPKLIEDGALKPTAYEVIEGLDAGKVNKVLKAYIDGKAVTKPQIHLS